MTTIVAFLGVGSWREVGQVFVTGVINGAGYALIGMSFALILSVTTRFHFAFAFTYTLAAYVAAVLVGNPGIPLLPAAVIGIACAIVAGMLIEGVVYAPLAARAGRNALLPVFVASLGIVIAGENLIRLLGGNDTRNLNGFPQKQFSPGNIDFSALDVTLVGIAIVVAVALWYVLTRTVLGQQIRAVRGNPEMALAVGVRVRRIYLLVFAIGTAVAGIAAVFDGMKFAVTPDMGEQPLFYAFVVAFLAGAARSPLRVATVGVLVGVIESVSTLWLSDKLSAVTVFGLLFLFLSVTSVPNGIRQLSGSLSRVSRAVGPPAASRGRHVLD